MECKLDNNKINVSNLVNGTYFIKIADQKQAGKLSITNMNGSLVFQQGYLQNEPIVIATQGWSKGVYLVQFTTSEHNFLTKIKIY